MTPPSFRFLGRRVYLAAVFVLRSTATHGLTVKRASRLHDLTGVSLRTLKRWRVWWLEIFPVTSFWRGSKELLSPPVAATSLPQPVVSRFRGETLRDRLIGTLRFFLPLSTTSAPEPELVK